MIFIGKIWTNFTNAIRKNIFVPMHIFYRLRIQFIEHKPALIGYKFDVILNLQISIFYQSYG